MILLAVDWFTPCVFVTTCRLVGEYSSLGILARFDDLFGELGIDAWGAKHPYSTDQGAELGAKPIDDRNRSGWPDHDLDVVKY
ncbi:hypothetical protein ACSLFT_31935 [Streptomyces sp. G6]|uniref:hypothetical protein n=1 Tax=Streptomyces sp. G6 TaxID=1178736 RepID=UPI003EDB0529